MADQFDAPLPERLYDEIYPSIAAWAQARPAPTLETADSGLNPVARENQSKRPTVPFAPLTREIGVTPVDDIPIIDLGRKEVSQVAIWVSRSKATYDLVQRAEGYEEPSRVYFGAQNRVSRKAIEGLGGVIGVPRPEVGRAAVHRQYEQTASHYLVARDRTEKASEYMTCLMNNIEDSEEGFVAVTESLQELANGVAANIDNLFPGGDDKAAIYGNSILTAMVALEKGEKSAYELRNLIYAAIQYVRKQEALWRGKMQQIVSFGVQNGFYVGKPDSDLKEDIA